MLKEIKKEIIGKWYMKEMRIPIKIIIKKGGAKEILGLWSRVVEIKIAQEEFTKKRKKTQTWHIEEGISKLKDRIFEITELENRTKDEEKWTEPKGAVRYHKTDEHIHWEFKKEKKNVKEILMKFMNIHLQETQTPVKEKLRSTQKYIIIKPLKDKERIFKSPREIQHKQKIIKMFKSISHKKP